MNLLAALRVPAHEVGAATGHLRAAGKLPSVDGKAALVSEEQADSLVDAIARRPPRRPAVLVQLQRMHVHRNRRRGRRRLVRRVRFINYHGLVGRRRRAARHGWTTRLL